MPGVEQVSVNLSTERAVISAHPEVEVAALERAVEQAGYRVRPRDAGPIRLQVIGMTCASCVRRVERALTAVPGVEHVSVNLASEIADVTPSGAVATDALLAALRRAGYDAVAPPTPRTVGGASDERRARHRAELRRRQLQLLTAAVLSGGVLIAAYGFSSASWSNAVQLALTLPVYLWTGAILRLSQGSWNLR